MGRLAMLLQVVGVSSLCKLVSSRTWYVKEKGSDGGDGSQAKPFKRISSAAASAQPGDTVQVGEGIYRERVAPVNSGKAGQPITYMAAPGENVVITAAEVLDWTKQADGTYKAELPDSLFDTLDGTPKSKLYNPFLDSIQQGVGCSGFTTGQVYADDEPLDEVDQVPHVAGCTVQYPTSMRRRTMVHTTKGCFRAAADGKSLFAQWPDSYNGTKPAKIEVTVRSRVFAPHKRGLQYINVQGFIIEHAANQWIANFWDPKNNHYAQSGALGTRSGYRWTIRNNTIRKAGTIGFDWGVEGGYAGHPVDNEGTDQPDPALHGDHTVEHNVFERNLVSGAQGYGASGDFRYNIIQDNGGRGCAGAENAAFKSHGYHGIFEGNTFRRNTVGLPIWFDGSSGPNHFTRNVVLLEPNSNSVAVFIELGAGPVVADNNIIEGPVIAQDASNVVLAHNLIIKYGGNAVDLHGLTGRMVAGKVARMSGWWLGANMLLSGNSPWLMVHHGAKKEGSGQELIYNETAQHNLITGTAPVYPTDAGLDITVSDNQDAGGSGFTVSVDHDNMVLSLKGDAVLDKVACQIGGPGGNKDFTGATRSKSKCMPGPVDALTAGQVRNISLWPTVSLLAPTPPFDNTVIV